MKRTSDDLFLDSLDLTTSATVRRALDAIDASNMNDAKTLLSSLSDKHTAVALYYLATLSDANEDSVGFANRHLQQLETAARLGYAPAFHKLAIYYDSGDLVKRDVVKAATLFKAAADMGHPHAQWIHGMDLLHGRSGIQQNEELGISYIQQAVSAKFEGALITLAEFYENESNNFPKNCSEASNLRLLAESSTSLGF